MRRSSLLTALLLCLLAGCPTRSPNTSGPTNGITWEEQGIKYVDYSISLGHRLTSDAGARSLEPVTQITHNGTSAANMMVFNQLMSVDDREQSEPEAATVYELAPGAEIGHYTPGRFKLPPGAKQCVVSYRVVFPNSDQVWINEVTIKLD